MLVEWGGNWVCDICEGNMLVEKFKGKMKEGVDEVFIKGDMELYRVIVYGFVKIFLGF